MTKKPNPLHTFIDTLFTDIDSIALTLLPEGGAARPINKTVSKKDLLQYVNPSTVSSLVSRNLNICICPNPLKPKTKRSIDNVKDFNAMFLDIDSKELALDSITPKPHYVFQRGENHFHVYWLLERIEATPENVAKYKKVQKKLVEKYNADPAATDIARLMRLPYTWQLKEKPYTQYKQVGGIGSERYKLKEIWETLKEQNIDRGAAFVDTDEFITEFIKADYTDRIFQGEGRSLELFYLGLNCHGWGLPQSEAIKLAHWLNETYCQPPETDRILEHQIDSAYRYAKSEFGAYRNDIRDAGSDKTRRKKLKLYKDCQKVRENLADFVYVAAIEQLINLTTGFTLTTKTQIENYIAHLCGTIVDLSLVITRRLVRVVERIDFRPDIKERIYEFEGEFYLNRFRGLNVSEEININTKENKKTINFFINHLKYLTTSPYEFETLLNYFAYIIQNPGKKLAYAALIISQFEGIGKSMLEVLFRNILKGYVASVENEQLGQGFNQYLTDTMLVFIHELAQGDRFNIANKFKNFISGSEFIEINAKYSRPYLIRNGVNFVMFSNRIDAAYITVKDRRYFVVLNDKQPMSSEYYDELYRIATVEFAAIYYYLLSVDLSNFNPHKRPEMTIGKQQLINQSQSELYIYLQNLEGENEGPFKYSLVLPADILRYLELNGPSIIKFKVGSKAIQHYLLDQGYSQLHIEKRVSGQRIDRVFWVKEKNLIGKELDAEIIKVLGLDVKENKEVANGF